MEGDGRCARTLGGRTRINGLAADDGVVVVGCSVGEVSVVGRGRSQDMEAGSQDVGWSLGQWGLWEVTI